MISPLSALRALAIGGPEAAAPAASTASAAASGGGDFASMLADMAGSGMKTVQAGEATAISGLQGKASVQQVVDAVMSAEQTLQAAIAIRDKVIGAYQEITRMAI
jgi:flagellar hook-basal body complex protein FliE